MPPEQYITASVDPGLQTYKGRAALGEVYRDQGRLADAERAWRGALAEQPDFTVAWLLLGDMWLVNGRWPELEKLVAELEANPKTRLDGAAAPRRGLMMRREFPAAGKLLEETIAANPQAPWPRELLGHAMLMEGSDPPRLVQVLRDLLTIDPTNNFALQQLPLAEQRVAGGS